MLHLSTSRFSFFQPQPTQHVELSPVLDEDNDELIQAIKADHEETWELDPTPDTTALSKFWSGVEDDLHNDPTWVTFTEDDES